MARGRKTSLTISLTPAQRQTLHAWQRGTTIAAGRARRGRIILLLADGVPISQIAAIVGIRRRFVYKWVQRFVQEGSRGSGRQTRAGPLPQGASGSPAGAARYGCLTHQCMTGTNSGSCHEARACPCPLPGKRDVEAGFFGEYAKFWAVALS